ncbi:hypothetical protein CEXT_548411 [Caerostris extrusa]|uniref:Uncharacterized protein n=1 Tax=Caerostris extrusa TaxID=172846 RepID=A0AAV4WMA7_CAEEX|nr:hypothetical protein CEXT_548411 [Caerostris extrusa]
MDILLMRNAVNLQIFLNSKGNDKYSFIEPKQTEIICDNIPLELSNEKATYDTKNLTEKNPDGDSIGSGNCDEKIIENVERIPNEDLIREGNESSTFKIFEDKVEDDSTSQTLVILEDYPWETREFIGGIPDDPPMIEKSSEDDLNSKSESSPLCYASKDSTHL